MTTTEDRVAAGLSKHLLAMATVEQRRAALVELATLVNEEERHVDKPLADVVPVIVPALASQFCDNPVEAFWQLVETTEQLRLFRGDPQEYAVKHDRGTSAESLSNLEDALEGDYDDVLKRLVGTPHLALTTSGATS